ncbi:hypothetical protein RyT2_14490 [Pseudolactococcus yaeyamensis]
MKGLVRLYCLLMLGSFWVVPILNFIFDGFKNFGYNIADILQANIMIMWVSVVVGKFKRFNALKKFAVFIVVVVIKSGIPEDWSLILSVGDMGNAIILCLCILATIIYYLKFIKSKVDKNGQLISKSESRKSL